MFPFSVSKIVVYGSPKASESVVTNVFVGNEAVSTACTGAKLPNQKQSFVIDKKYRAADNIYSIQVMSAHNMQITKIEIYEEVVGAPEAPQFSIKEGIYGVAQSLELTCATDGATINYFVRWSQL